MQKINLPVNGIRIRYKCRGFDRQLDGRRRPRFGY